MATNPFAQFVQPEEQPNPFAQFVQPEERPNPFAQFVKPEPTPEEQSVFRQVADPFLKAGAGVVMGVRMIADAFGAGSETSQTLRGAEDWIAALYSAQSQRDSKKVAQIIDAAKDKGVWEQVKAGVSAFLEAPIDIVSQGLGTAAPTILASLATTVLGAPAAVTAAVGLGLGATMGAGTVKGAIYDAVKEELAKTNMPKDEIEKRAQLAQEYGGANLDQILMGSAIGGLAARSGLESSVARAAAARITGKAAAAEAAEAATRQQVAKETAEAAARGPLLQGARTAATESGTEFLQGSQEQVAQNIALQREGFDVPTFRGAVAQGTLEALAGAPLGAGFGAREAVVARQEEARLADITNALNISALGLEGEQPLEGVSEDESQIQDRMIELMASRYESMLPKEVAYAIALQMFEIRRDAEAEAKALGLSLPDTAAGQSTDTVVGVDPMRVRDLEDSFLAEGNDPGIAKAAAIAQATQEAYDDWIAERSLGEQDVRQPVQPAGGEGVRVAGEPPAGAPAGRAGVSEAAGVVPPAADAGVPAGREEPAPGALTDVERPGYVRVYHSGSAGEGDSGRWVSTDKRYASNYRKNLPLFVTYVREDDPRVNNPDYPDEQGVKQGFVFNFELTPEEATTLREIPRTGAPSGTQAPKAVETKEERPAVPAEGTAAPAATPAKPTKPEKPLGAFALADKLAKEVSEDVLAETKQEELRQELTKRGLKPAGIDAAVGRFKKQVAAAQPKERKAPKLSLRNARFAGAPSTERLFRAAAAGKKYPGKFWSSIKEYAERYLTKGADKGQRALEETAELPKRTLNITTLSQASKAEKDAMLAEFSAWMQKNAPNVPVEDTQLYDVLTDQTTDFAYPQKEDVKYLKYMGYDSVFFAEEGGEKVDTWFAFDKRERAEAVEPKPKRARGRPALPAEERKAKVKARTSVRAQAGRDARRLKKVAKALTTKDKERRKDALYTLLDIVKTSQSTPRVNQARNMLKANSTEAERAELEKGYGDWKAEQAENAAFKAAEREQKKRKLTPEQKAEKEQIKEETKAIKFRGSAIYIVEDLPDGEIGLVLPIVSIKPGPILTEVNRGRSFLEAKKAEEQLAFELATKNVEGKTEGSTFRMVDKGAYDIQKQRKRLEEKAATASARRAKKTEQIKKQREDKINAQKKRIADLGKKLAAFRQNKPVNEAELLLKEKQYKLEQLRLKVFEEKPIDWDADWEQGTKVRSLEDAAQEIRALQPKKEAKKGMTFEQQFAAARNIESKLKAREPEEDVSAVVEQVTGARGRKAAEEAGTDDIALAGLFDSQVGEEVEAEVEAEPAVEAKAKKPAGEKKKRKSKEKPIEEPKQLTPQEQYAALVENLPGAPAFDALSEEAQKQITDLAERNQLNLAAINRIAAEQAPKFYQSSGVDKAAAALAAILGKAKVKLQNLPQKGDVLTFRIANRAKQKFVVDRIGEYRNSWAVWGKVYDETGEEITDGIYDVTKEYDKETGVYRESWRNTGLDRFFLSNFKETNELAGELNSVAKPSIAELKKAEEAADEARQQQAEDEVYAGPLALVRQRLENTNFQNKLQVQEYAKRLEKEGVIDSASDIVGLTRDPEYDTEALRSYLINVLLGDAIAAAITKRKAELDAEQAPKFSQTANVDKADARFSKFTTAGQATAHVARTGNAFQRALARRLSGLKILQDTKFVVLEPNDPTPKELKGDPGWAAARGVFIPSTNTIYVRSASDAMQGANNITVLHEVLHAALHAKIDTGRQRLKAYRDALLRGKPVSGFATEVEGLFVDLSRIARRSEAHFRALKDMPEELLLTVASTQNEQTGKFEIFTNLDEFLSYGMSDPVFQDFLKTVPMEGTTGFSRFVQAILRFLGMASGDQSALARLVDATDKLIAVPGKFVFRGRGVFPSKGVTQKILKTAAQAEPTTKQYPKEVQAELKKLQKALGSASSIQRKAREQAANADKILAKVLRSHSSSTQAMQGLQQAVNNRGASGQNLNDALAAQYKGFKGGTLRQLLPALQTETVVDWAGRLGLNNVVLAWDQMKNLHAAQLKSLNEAAPISERLLKLQQKKPGMFKTLAATMHYSTLRGVDPSTEAGRKASPSLARLWNSLSPEAKSLYETVRDFHAKNYNKHFELLEKLVDSYGLDGNIADASTPKGSIVASIRLMQEQGAGIKPYFPLMRFGNFWVRTGKGKDSTFHMFESQAAKEAFIEQHVRGTGKPKADLYAAELLKDGNDISSARKDMSDYNELLKRMFTNIDSMETQEVIDDFGNPSPELTRIRKEQLKDNIYQMILHTLPDASYRKQFIHRQGKEGFSEDIGRSFATLSTAMANQLARLEYSQQIQNALSSARSALQGNPDAARLNEFIKEMEARAKLQLDPSPENSVGNQMANLANQTSFIYMMTNIKTAVAQMFAVPMFVAPVLQSKHGIYRTAKALGSFAAIWNSVGMRKENADGSTSWVAPTIAQSRRVKLNPEERRAAQYMVDRGLSETTLAYDLGNRKQTPTEVQNSAPRRMLKASVNAMTALFHHTERLIREVSFMASFRLNRQKFPNASFEEIAQLAEKETFDALGNYASINRPRGLGVNAEGEVMLDAHKPLGRAVLQFKMFPAFVTTYFVRNFYRMVGKGYTKEERKAAFIQFFGTLMMSFTLAGVMGIPGFSFALGVLSGLRKVMADDDEDDPLDKRNLEFWFRNIWMPQTFGDIKIGGKPLSDIMDRGVLAAMTGFDMTSSLSMNGLWLPSMKESPSVEASVKEYLLAIMGPFASLVGEQIPRAIDNFNRGKLLEGMEQMMPAILRSPITAYRYSTEGAQTTWGAGIKPASEFTLGQIIGQGLGFSTEGLVARREDLFKANQLRMQVRNKKRSLMDRLDQEVRTDDDVQAAIDKIVKFNQKNWFDPIRGEELSKSLLRRMERRVKADRGADVEPNYYPQLLQLLEGSRRKLEAEAAK